MTDIKNGDMPANPTKAIPTNDAPYYKSLPSNGLTKREAFAMAAMQGMSSDPEFYGQSVDFAKNIAIDSVKLADALLLELSK